MRVATALRIVSVVVVAKALLIGVVYWRRAEILGTSDGSTIIPPTPSREECEASSVAHRRPGSATPATSASARRVTTA
jgi:hypothetical protein